MVRIVLCLFFLIVVSCKDDNVATKEFSYNGNSWRSIERAQTIGAITYSATQVPLQYYILKNLGVANIQKADSIYSKLSQERIVVMEFEEEKGQDLLLADFTSRDYDASVRYMAFDIKNDFNVITVKGDTIPCKGVHFERNFKTAPFKRVLLYFGGIPQEERTTLVYKDQLFNQGTLQFDFDTDPIKL